MYLISSSKLRKARQQLNNVQPYFLKISSTIADILHHSPEIEHIYFDKRPEVKRRKSGYIVITGDKGLAGAYNHNVLRLAEKHLAQEDDPTLFLIGQMGRAYFAERDIRVDGEFMFTVQDPTIARARDIADIFIRLFREGQLADVYVVYTEMVDVYKRQAVYSPAIMRETTSLETEKKSLEAMRMYIWFCSTTGRTSSR